jgi:hypothetical protein
MVRERTPGSVRNIYTGPAVVDGETEKYSVPSGYRPPYTWVLAPKSGAMRVYVDGTSTVTGAGARGVNVAGTIAGVATLTGTGILVVSASGTAAGVGSMTGSLLAILVAAGSTAGVASAAASINALGWANGAAAGAATATATRYATGELAGEITPYTELSPESLAASVWSALATQNNDAGTMGEKLNDAGSAANPWTETIETGMTAAQAMRLIVAAVAGKLSGAASTTITIRNAVADDANRIVATVDEDGNRTAITYDLD